MFVRSRFILFLHGPLYAAQQQVQQDPGHHMLSQRAYETRCSWHLLICLLWSQPKYCTVNRPLSTVVPGSMVGASNKLMSFLA